MPKLIMIAALFIAQAARAEVQTETIAYKQGEKILQGFMAFDEKLAAKRPGVLVVHDWMGLNAFAKKRTNDLAQMGFTAFAVDVYGKDVRPNTTKEAGELAGIYKTDRALLRERIKAAYQELIKHKTVDPKRIAVIGFCFGGMTALELARAGADLKAVVSFHGNLDSPTPADAKNIKAKVLVLHGHDDPYVPPAQVAEFEKEMKLGRVDYTIERYPGAVHAFTNPEAGTDNSKGAAYNADADAKSKIAMKQFLNEVFSNNH